MKIKDLMENLEQFNPDSLFATRGLGDEGFTHELA